MAKKRSSLKNNRPGKDGKKPEPNKLKRRTGSIGKKQSFKTGNHSMNPGISHFSSKFINFFRPKSGKYWTRYNYAFKSDDQSFKDVQK